MASNRERYPRLVGLFFIGSMLFSPPILSLFNSRYLLGGVPLLYLFIFGTWFIFIMCIFLIARHRSRNLPQLP